MPVYKVSFIYKLFDQGWTESFYGTFSNAGQAVALTQQEINKYLIFRSAQTELQAIRALEVGGVRRGAPRPLNLRSQRLTSTTPDITGATAQIQLYSVNGHNRILNVRGLDDGDVERTITGSSNPKPFLQGKLEELVTEIKEFGWQIQYLTEQVWYGNLTLAPMVGNDNVTTVNFNVAQTTPIPGEYVHFRGYDRCILHNFSAPFRVLSATAGQFSIGYKWRLKDASLAPASLQWQKVVYGYDDIIGGGFKVFTTRKTGRPFGLSRGRIPARSCRR